MSSRPNRGAVTLFISASATFILICMLGPSSWAQSTIRLTIPNTPLTPPAIDVLHSGTSGTVTASTYDATHYPHGYSFEHLYIGADNLTFDSSMAGRAAAWGQEIDYHFGGPQATGPRGAQMLYSVLDAPMLGSDPNNLNPFFGAQWAFAISDVNNRGTTSTSRGNLYSINPQCQLYNGATFWSTIECNETDVEVDEGASVEYKFGENITTIGSDSVHGSVREAALHIGAVTSTNGWNFGIMFSDYSGSGKPVGPTGTLIGSAGNVGTVANGVDLRGFTIGNLSFASPGFSVSGSGQVFGTTLQASTELSAPDFNTGSDPGNGGY